MFSFASKPIQAFSGIFVGVLIGALLIGVLSLLQDGSAPGEFQSRPSKLIFEQQTQSEKNQILRAEIVRYSQGQGELSQRMLHLEELGNDLSKREQEELMSTLYHFNDSVGLLEASYFNQILNLLAIQEDVPEQIASTLSFLALSNTQPELIRRYSLQHMRGFWHRVEEGGQQEIESALQKVVIDAPTPERNSALLSLHVLSEASPRLRGNSIVEMAHVWLADQTSEPSSRLLALRIVREKKSFKAVGVARTLAFSDSEPVAIRLGAIAALGELGEQSDIELLSAVAEENSIFSTAARISLLALLAN